MHVVSKIRKAIVLLTFFSMAGFALAQNSRIDGIVSSRYNNPAAGAFVAACLQPATITTTAPYCTPLAPLCASLTDAACNTSTFPVQADGLGNYHFYVNSAGGPYTYCFYGSSLAVPILGTGCLPDQNVPNGSGSIANNATTTFTNALSATASTGYSSIHPLWGCWDGSTPANAIYPSNVSVNFSSGVITFTFLTPQTGFCVVNGSAGQFSALDLTNPGVFTNSQANLYLVSSLGGINIGALFSSTFGGGHQTDAVSGGVLVPVGATTANNNGIAGYCQTIADSISRTEGNCVALFGITGTLANNAAGWGMNTVIFDAAGLSGHSMIGNENDMNLLGSPAFWKGFYLTGLNQGGTLPATATGFEISTPYKIPIGFICDRGACAVGLQLNDAFGTNPSASEPIQFLSHNSGGTLFVNQIGSDSSGNLNLTASNVVASGNLTAAGSLTTYSQLQVVANQYAGSTACVSSTKAISLPITYANQPAILVFDETTKGGANLTAKSTSGFTVSCSGASDVFDWMVVGNPN